MAISLDQQGLKEKADLKTREDEAGVANNSWWRVTLLRSAIANLGRLITLLVIWEAAAWILKGIISDADSIIPPIEDIIFRALPSFGVNWTGRGGGQPSYLAGTLMLMQHSFYTAQRVLGGSFIGIGLGILIGLLIGWDRRIRDFLWPSIQILRPIPNMALIPLFMVWFGAREGGVWAFVIWNIFAMMVVFAVEAIKNVPPILIDYARTRGASRFDVYRTIVLPAIVPNLIGGIRVSLGVSWAISLGGEFVGTQDGLGRLLILSQTFFDAGRMVVVAILYVILGITTDFIIVKIANRMTRWVPRSE